MGFKACVNLKIHRTSFLRPFFPYSSCYLLPTMPHKLSDYEIIARDYASRAATALRTHLHLAFIYARGGALIAMSTNRVGSRRMGAGFSDYTIHAERAVLKSAGDTSLLRGATLVVVRISKQGKILGSEPCHECKCHLSAAMRKYGLNRVYFS